MGRQRALTGRADRPPCRPPRFIGKTAWHTAHRQAFKPIVAIIEGAAPTHLMGAPQTVPPRGLLVAAGSST
jgi:hypothetical protein